MCPIGGQQGERFVLLRCCSRRSVLLVLELNSVGPISVGLTSVELNYRLGEKAKPHA